VHDPESPYLGQYAKEFVLSLSDWYHDQMTDLLPSFISLYNPTGAEPVPDSALMNDNQNGTFAVEPNTTYMFHMVNMGAFAGQYLWFEGHTMQIVEVDGVWTEAQEAEMIYITAANDTACWSPRRTRHRRTLPLPVVWIRCVNSEGL